MAESSFTGILIFAAVSTGSTIAMIKLRLSKALVGLIALLALNYSVDTAYDPVPLKWNGHEYAEDLTFNDIESIYELVTECWMEMEDDFVPEDEDSDGYEISKTLKDWTHEPPIAYQFPEPSYNKFYTEHIIRNYASIALDINLPPPDHLS